MDRSYNQSNFLGGEFSPNAMGRFDDPNYQHALAISSNGFPVEEGAWTRRGGTAVAGTALFPGIVRTWYLSDTGDNNGTDCVLMVLCWTGSQAKLFCYQWPYINLAPTASFNAPYGSLAEIRNVQVIPTDYGCYFLSKLQVPQILFLNNGVLTFQGIDPGKLDGPYLDPLPGLSQTSNSIGQVTAGFLTGTGVSAGSALTFQINDGAYSFLSSDVGRAIRLWSQPSLWSATGTYNTGTVVTYNGAFWQNLIGTAANGVVPGSQTLIGGFIVVPWILVPQQGNWAYGFISSVAGSSCVVTLIGPFGLPHCFDASQPSGNGEIIDTWQLGVYTGNMYPACGCWHEGRLWLGGARPNRTDASQPNGLPLSPSGLPLGTNGTLGPSFSPTDQFGTVTDASGISYIFATDGVNLPLWFQPEHNGIIMGTSQSEWQIIASNLNDPLTPTSIQAHRSTKYGSAFTKALRVGMAVVSIQTMRRRVMELMVDLFSQRLIGRHLNEFAKHLPSHDLPILQPYVNYSRGFVELAYQEEQAPIIWAIDTLGNLYGCTYRRVSHFGQEPPKFNGWHRHSLGTGNKILSITDCTINFGAEMSLALLTQNETTGAVQLEVMMPFQEPDNVLTDAWFVDGGVSGAFGASIVGGDFGSQTILTFTGFPHPNGTKVSCFIGGLDFGDTVVSGGEAQVHFASDPEGKGTKAYLISLNGPNYGFQHTPVTLNGNTYHIPVCIGANFISQMTTVRPESTETLQGQSGHSFARLRRMWRWGAIFENTTAINVQLQATSTDALSTFAYPVQFRSPNQQLLPVSSLFTGIFSDTVECDENFDNQITVLTTRPQPCTVCSVSGLLNVSDR